MTRLVGSGIVSSGGAVDVAGTTAEYIMRAVKRRSREGIWHSK
jgi:hypothetical protein